MSSLKIFNKSIISNQFPEIKIETGKLAKQADGSVVLKVGNMMILATVVATPDAKDGVDFLPLSVDYQEKYASNGRIPGGFFKRESKLSDYEVLICRLVDRALRPLFPSDFHADVQVALSLISADSNYQPDAYAALAASAAIMVSNIPFQGPISEVRIIRKEGQFIVNPTIEQTAGCDMDLIVAASFDNIGMVEGECNEVSEEDMIEALKIAHSAIKVQCTAQIELAKEVGRVPKEYSHEKNDFELKAKLKTLLYDKVYKVARMLTNDKAARSQAFKAVVKEYIDSLPEDSTEDKGLIKKYYHDIEKDAVRDMALNEGLRLDGRKTDEIRNIWSEIDYLPSAHGSAIFTRGETQSLTTVTVGSKVDEAMIDTAMKSEYTKFILHYNFPGFSTGEVKPNRGPGRREVGHGNLAMRSLKKILPPESENPYTIRIVSDILESNGSSSMATVCAGSLALHDAGIQVKSHVSGIAMGLIADPISKKYAILSDILGDEDHLGDMDFKVTGTAKGITACQMDLKVDGLSYEVLSKALHQAKVGRLHILSKLNETIAEPRKELKPHAPRVTNIIIDKEFIGAVIGPGGKIIQEIQRTSGATVVIEEKDNKGHINVFSNNKTAMDEAVKRINAIVAIPEIGEVYEGKVKNIQAFGAFVEFMPGKDGLLHISEIKWERLETMDGVFQEGEIIKVKLIDVDKKTGKYKLSRKVLLPKPETQPA